VSHRERAVDAGVGQPFSPIERHPFAR
jgi:hypothetical protein